MVIVVSVTSLGDPNCITMKLQRWGWEPRMSKNHNFATTCDNGKDRPQQIPSSAPSLRPPNNPGLAAWTGIAPGTRTPCLASSVWLHCQLLINGRSLVIMRRGRDFWGLQIDLADWDGLGLDADPCRGASGVKEQARGSLDNGTPFTPFKREHVYGYLEEIDLIVPEMHVWTPLALLLAICL